MRCLGAFIRQVSIKNRNSSIASGSWKSKRKFRDTPSTLSEESACCGRRSTQQDETPNCSKRIEQQTGGKGMRLYLVNPDNPVVPRQNQIRTAHERFLTVKAIEGSPLQSELGGD